MIEAVNSTIAASVVSRGNAEQQGSARALTADLEPVREVARAPFVSPYISVDTNFDRAILQIRDSDTGDVLRQYPTESQLEAYRRAQSTEQAVVRTETQEPAQPQHTQQQEPTPLPSPEIAADTQAAQQAQQQVSAPVTEAVSVDTQA